MSQNKSYMLELRITYCRVLIVLVSQQPCIVYYFIIHQNKSRRIGMSKDCT